MSSESKESPAVRAALSDIEKRSWLTWPRSMEAVLEAIWSEPLEWGTLFPLERLGRRRTVWAWVKRGKRFTGKN